MGRIFQTRGARGAGAAGGTSHFKSKQAEKAGYRSFYNVQKTKLTARYPFLPNNQIERRIKQLWESSSAEKRATFCSSLGGTTPAKSPFRGSILKGLLKNVRSPENPLARQQQPQCVAGSRTGPGPLSTSSPRVDNLPLTARHGILRSSEKKRHSTPRVSFRLDSAFMPSPISSNRFPNPALNLQHAFEGASNAGTGTNGCQDAKGALNPEPSAAEMALTTKPEMNGHCLDDPMSQESDEIKTTGDNVDKHPLENQRSTADVNVAGDLRGGQGRKKKSLQVAEAKSTLNKAEEVVTDDKGLSAEPREQSVASTPSHRSTRAAAIAAKSKITSPAPGRSRSRSEPQEKSPQRTWSKSPSKNQALYRLKKTELSMEEKQIYEFEDDSSGSKKPSKRGKAKHFERTVMTTRPRLHNSDAVIVKNPEEYNLDSNINKGVFGSETGSQSQQLDSREGDVKESSKRQVSMLSSTANKALTNGVQETQPKRKRGRPKKSGNNQVQKDTGPKTKKGRPKKSATSVPMKQTKLTDLHKKSVGVMKVAEKGKKKQASLSQDDDDSDDTTSVPWMVSAHPSSSSDEEATEDLYESEEDAYQHYQREESSSLPSSVPDSQEHGCSSQKVCESFEAFCRTSIKANDPSPLQADVPFEDQDNASSIASMEDAEIMSISTEYSMLSPSEFAFPGVEPPTSKMTFLMPMGEDTKLAVSRKQKMRLQDGELSDSSQVSQDECYGGKQTTGYRREQTSWMKDSSRNGQSKQHNGLTGSSDLMTDGGFEGRSLINPEKRKSVRKGRAARQTDSSSSSQDTDVGSNGKRMAEPCAEKDKPKKRIGGSERATRSKRKCADFENLSDAKNPPLSTAKAKVKPGVGVVMYDSAESAHQNSNQPLPKKPCRTVLAEKNVSTPLVHTGRSYVECGHGVKGGSKQKVASNVRKCRKSQENKPLMESNEESDSIRGKKDLSDHGQKSSEVEESAAPGDGLLCDLFQPNEGPIQSDRRYIPAQEAEPVSSDPVASHLFQEENYFD